MPEPFASLLESVLAAVREHQYFTLFAVIAIEEAGIPLPVPGDLVIAFYGWRAGGDLVEMAQVMLTCAAASSAGTLLPYALARRFGRTVAMRLAAWLDVDAGRVERLVWQVDRYGTRGVLVGRLIPGLRVAISLVAGTARMPTYRFSAGVLVAAVIYWTGWVALGAIVGPRVEDVVSPTYIRVFVVLTPIVITLAFVGRLVWARRHAARS